MRLYLTITIDNARTAIMHSIGLDEKITSKKKFKSEIQYYFYQYGVSKLDSHYMDNETHKKEADRLVQKYFASK